MPILRKLCHITYKIKANSLTECVGFYFISVKISPTPPIRRMIMPVIWLINFNSLMFSLFLNLLTKMVSKFHHNNAPPKMDKIPQMETNRVVLFPIN